MRPSDDRRERYLRYSRGGMVLLLIMVLLFGAGGIVIGLRPEGMLSRWLDATPWFFLLVAAVLLASQLWWLRGERWDPRSPEARAVMQDEWRLANMARAQRSALVVVLIAQVPLAMLLASRSPSSAVIVMALATITLGVATLLSVFLLLDRLESDG